MKEKIVIRRVQALEFTPAAATPPVDQLNPRMLLLYSLGLCTGKTVVSLADKMKVPLTDFRVEVTGNIPDDPAMPYSQFDGFGVRIVATAEQPDQTALEKDIEQRMVRAAVKAEDKYCPVTLMVQRIAPVKLSLYLNNKRLPLSKKSVE